MKHYDEYIIQLIQLYLVGDLCGEEKVKLEEWVSQDPSHEKLFKEIILVFKRLCIKLLHGIRSL